MTPAPAHPVLVDSSVWIDHFRRQRADLAALIQHRRARVHDFVIGELALGHLSRRSTAVADLAALPRATTASHDEVLTMVRAAGIEGSGIGWIDAHLIASAMIDAARLWTLDKRLAAVAHALRLSI